MSAFKLGLISESHNKRPIVGMDNILFYGLSTKKTSFAIVSCILDPFSTGKISIFGPCWGLNLEPPTPPP